MDDDLDDTTGNLVTKIVTSYVAHQHVAPDELANLISSVHEALSWAPAVPTHRG